MRDDMAKVIVEQRLGGGKPKGYHRRTQRTPLGDLWKRASIKHASRNNPKCLNENLAPLRRFLRNHLGRPWDIMMRYALAVERQSWSATLRDFAVRPIEAPQERR
jgi:hypothetical protein